MISFVLFCIMNIIRHMIIYIVDIYAIIELWNMKVVKIKNHFVSLKFSESIIASIFSSKLYY